jgi:hypothetical protein
MRAVMPELKLFLTSLRLVEVDRAQFCSIKPAIVRPAARRDRKPVLSEAAHSEHRFHHWNNISGKAAMRSQQSKSRS